MEHIRLYNANAITDVNRLADKVNELIDKFNIIVKYLENQTRINENNRDMIIKVGNCCNDNINNLKVINSQLNINREKVLKELDEITNETSKS